MAECYSSARLAVLINGSPSKEFSMERGLRQRDPLSPFLFLVAAEGLSSILVKAVEEGVINGVDWMNNGDKLFICNSQMIQFYSTGRMRRKFKA
ncbi:hypothetical protein QQ045_015474 [Rhodiola kirilowii]